MEQREDIGPEETGAGASGKEAPPQSATQNGQPKTPVPPPSFVGFVQGLAGQCLIALGHAKNPLTGRAETSLEQAKYTIDMLDILEAKTKGNLTEEEKTLLGSVLYDLRMRYVEACQRTA